MSQLPKRKYDSTVARIAGNIASGMGSNWIIADMDALTRLASVSVTLARAIVAETERTEPTTERS